MINLEDIDNITICKDELIVQLKDGRRGVDRFQNYERLRNANESQRNNYTLSYYGLHWPEIDEDLSFDGFFN